MTADAFRRAALALPGAIESAHMRHPDFRVAQRIFATLGSPDAAWGMVKLPPEEQKKLVEAMPETFTPAAGAWGRQGSTLVRLAKAKPVVLVHSWRWRGGWRRRSRRRGRPGSAVVLAAPGVPVMTQAGGAWSDGQGASRRWT